MLSLPPNWEALIFSHSPRVVNPEEQERNREMYRRCGLPYGFGSEPFVLSQNQSEPASIDEFIDFTPSERDSDGKKINETPMILGLEDEFFQRLAALITTAEISDMFILLTAIIATAHAKYRRDDEEDKDEEEWILNNVLMKNQNWETFKQGILALLMKLDTLACTQPSICWLPEFAQEKETYARSKTNSFSLVGFAQRISLPGSELLIDQARWEWIREKRGGFAFTTHYLEDTPVIKDIGTWEWEKTYLWCANLFFILLETKHRVMEIPDISNEDILAPDNTLGYVDKLYLRLGWQK